MPRPTHCAGDQHVISWITDVLGVCSGHPKVVWKYKKGTGGWIIQGEWNEVAVELAHMLLKKSGANHEPTPQYVLPSTLPEPATIEPIPDHARYIMMDFFKSRGMKQASAAKVLEVSRGLWSDIIRGRRAVTQSTWVAFRRLHASS